MTNGVAGSRRARRWPRARRGSRCWASGSGCPARHPPVCRRGWSRCRTRAWPTAIYGPGWPACRIPFSRRDGNVHRGLVAAGALAADDPAIGQVRAVAGGLFQGSGTIPGTNAALPEPWRSMLARRGRAGGPQGLAVAGATTPPLDGVTLALLAVRSTDEWFCADVETVPGLPHWHWPHASGVVDRPLLAWWAADDRAITISDGRGSGTPTRTARRAGRVLARARPGRPGARHHAHHDDRAGRDPGAAGVG